LEFCRYVFKWSRSCKTVSMSYSNVLELSLVKLQLLDLRLNKSQRVLLCVITGSPLQWNITAADCRIINHCCTTLVLSWVIPLSITTKSWIQHQCKVLPSHKSWIVNARFLIFGRTESECSVHPTETSRYWSNCSDYIQNQ
jgi:hypothetical protein